METRIVGQVRIFKLVLNPMMGKSEERVVAAVSTSYEKLIEFYDAQKYLTPVRDEQPTKTLYGDTIFMKAFKEGPLHWFNPLNNTTLGVNNMYGQGIFDEWVVAEDWNTLVANSENSKFDMHPYVVYKE